MAKNKFIYLSRKNLLRLLLKESILTKEDIIKIQRINENTLQKVEDIILSLDILSEDKMMYLVGKYLKLPYKKLDPLEIDQNIVTQLLPPRFAQKHNMLVIGKDADSVIIAIGNPFDSLPLDDIENMTGLKVKVVISSKKDILKIINYYYGLKQSLSMAQSELAGPTVDIGNLEQLHSLESLSELTPTAQPIIKAVNHLIFNAIDQRASDIHIEPKRDETVVRYRIDGILHNVLRIMDTTPTKRKLLHSAIVSRIKMMASLDIAEKRRPQGGRIKIKHETREIEMRLSVLPVAFGEKIVIRLFDSSVLIQDIEKLGFSDEEMAKYSSFINKPNGIILISGPTGSGKTTTLYSTLSYLNSEDVNIITIEDPVEMVCESFNQITVNPKVDLTFSNALRTILRQDPDIIMVGEIRDFETAKNAIQSSLTGHLVFSTVHTNDSPSAITRLLDMGIEPFLVSSTLIGVVAQRLLRKTCPFCAKDYVAKENDLKLLNITPDPKRKIILRKGLGCNECRQTGYLGRSAIFEVFEITNEIKKLINNKRSVMELKAKAIEEGLVTLRESAIRKLAQKVVTIDEILRILADRDLTK